MTQRLETGNSTRKRKSLKQIRIYLMIMTKFLTSSGKVDIRIKRRKLFLFVYCQVGTAYSERKRTMS